MMAILGMPRATIVEVVNLAKTMEEELMPSKKYSNKVQDELKNKESDYDFDEKPQKMKKYKTKQQIDMYRWGIYYHNCYNDGHYIEECKLLYKFCCICNSDDYNTDQCTKKDIRECKSHMNVHVNVMQVQAKEVAQTKQHEYPRANNQRRFGNQPYNQPLGRNN